MQSIRDTVGKLCCPACLEPMPEHWQWDGFVLGLSFCECGQLVTHGMANPDLSQAEALYDRCHSDDEIREVESAISQGGPGNASAGRR